MTDKQRKICEDLGWEVYETEDDIELRKCSSLGEDFGFSVKADKFLEDLRDYYEYFDPEEHAAMWYNARHNVRGVPQSLRALLDDAIEIDGMLENLCIELSRPEEQGGE